MPSGCDRAKYKYVSTSLRFADLHRPGDIGSVLIGYSHGPILRHLSAVRRLYRPHSSSGTSE